MCYDGDGCDAWTPHVQRARKPYKCDECDAPIPAGVRYVRIGSLFDGHWETMRVHWECLQLWYTVQLHLCGGRGLIIIGGLDEELREYDDENVRFGTDDEPQETEAAPYRARLEAIRAKYRAVAA